MLYIRDLNFYPDEIYSGTVTIEEGEMQLSSELTTALENYLQDRLNQRRDQGADDITYDYEKFAITQDNRNVVMAEVIHYIEN